MQLTDQVAAAPEQPGVYLFKDALGTIIYVGKANSLRHRLKSYLLDSRIADAKTGSLVREIADLETIVLDNEKEALALENQLIKRHKPRFNVLLRDDKTYPYIRYTAFEKFPRVYVTRRLSKDGSLYFGPYFPHSLAHRIVHLIHRRFLVPSCTVDLERAHPRPCLQYYIKRCLGPCVPGLTSDERYAEAARDVRLFLEGKRADLLRSLRARIATAADAERFEEAAQLRDLLRTVEEIDEKQRIAAAEGNDTDVLAWHAEPPLAAVSLFHMRGGRVVDKRDFFWEELEEFAPTEFLPSLLKQLYLDAAYWPRFLHVPADFDDRALLEDLLGERSGHRVEILTPQRGPKRAFLDLVERNARHSFEQRFRVRKPSPQAIAEALESAFTLPEPPCRIECFDISHTQGAETVASMVVWEDGRMRKSDYRKFIIRWEGLGVASQQSATTPRSAAFEGGTAGLKPGATLGSRRVDDFAAMREAVTRRYRRLRDEQRPLPGLILIDGGIGQLHAAAAALDSLEIINQPLAAIAKPQAGARGEGQGVSVAPPLQGGIVELKPGAPASSRHTSLVSGHTASRAPRKVDAVYVLGQEDAPIRLDRHSPILHLIQQIRDETHRFAVTFHRQRRNKATLRSALTDIPGIGEKTARALLRKFGSLARIRQATEEELRSVVSGKQARAIHEAK